MSPLDLSGLDEQASIGRMTTPFFGRN